MKFVGLRHYVVAALGDVSGLECEVKVTVDNGFFTCGAGAMVFCFSRCTRTAGDIVLVTSIAVERLIKEAWVVCFEGDVLARQFCPVGGDYFLDSCFSVGFVHHSDISLV